MADSAYPIRRVLVLGHTGFIGGNIWKEFQTKSPTVELVGRAQPELDMTRLEQVQQIASLLSHDTVLIVCAAIKKQLGDNLDSFTANLKMATNLCRVLEANPIGRLIYFSSAAVYGEDVHNTNITEDTTPQPTSYYGLAKYTSELLLRKTVGNNPASSLVLLRPTLVYGPGDQGGYGPTGFIKSALANEQITFWGDGLELREFIYAGDLARLVHRLVFSDFSGVLNVVSGRSYTFKDALDAVSQQVPLTHPVGSRARSKAKVDHGFNNARLRTFAPDFQFTNLAEGVALTLAAHRS